MTGELRRSRFEKALRLLLRLHELGEAGLNDSEEADDVREQMDVHWNWCIAEEKDVLTENEIRIIDDVSAALRDSNE